MSDLNELLADIGDRARIYDVTERALELGRRRRNTRRLAGVGGIAAVVALSILGAVSLPTATDPIPLTPSPSTAISPSPPPAVTVAACVPRQLPVPKGYPAKSVVTGGDPTGRYLVGRAYPGDARDRLLIWDDGRVKAFDQLGDDTDLHDVSSTGIAVGYGYDTAGKALAVIYREGRLSRLKGVDATAIAVNASGVVAGTFQGRPAVWRSPDAGPVRLPVPEGMDMMWVTGVDADGTVSGRLGVYPPAPARHGSAPTPLAWERAVIWGPDGTMRELPVPASIDGRPVAQSAALDIHDGWVGGWLITGTTDDDRRQYVARWNLATGEVTWFPSARRAYPVSASGIGIDARSEGRSTMVLPQGTVPLPDVKGAVVDSAEQPDIRSVSADGRIIAGYQSVSGGEGLIVAVAWHCT